MDSRVLTEIRAANDSASIRMNIKSDSSSAIMSAQIAYLEKSSLASFRIFHSPFFKYYTTPSSAILCTFINAKSRIIEKRHVTCLFGVSYTTALYTVCRELF